MNLQQLKYIVEIADCHSITKASKKLFVSQPYWVWYITGNSLPIPM